jgi:hypothetical protein
MVYVQQFAERVLRNNMDNLSMLSRDGLAVIEKRDRKGASPRNATKEHEKSVADMELSAIRDSKYKILPTEHPSEMEQDFTGQVRKNTEKRGHG